jgi:acetyl-CoA carboxylase/biotin carboxylase 1
MGVIAVETRTVEQIVPADPATPNSSETINQRAGQVWYPDSSYKTAQGIRDMIAEDLPLIVFANWRGFSGGMRDMFEEVLKFGSMIVDSFCDYRKPVFVYIPPGGTLRGGAWVVLDSTINSKYMEMYCDRTGKGGVLEVEGVLDVKFRTGDILKTAHRLDESLQRLDARLAALTQGVEGSKFKTKTDESKVSSMGLEEVKTAIAAREKAIMPLYHQVAGQFCDLHDGAGRMAAKGVIRDTLDWRTSREYFYWRLRRRLLELEIVGAIETAAPTTANPDAVLLAWLTEDLSAQYAEKTIEDDKLFIDWVKQHSEFLDNQLEALRKATVVANLAGLIKQMKKTDLIESLASIMSSLSPEQRTQVEKGMARPSGKKKSNQ